MFQIGDMSNKCVLGCGLVLAISGLDQSAHAANASVVHLFSGTDGSFPTAGLVADAAGNLYGTAHYGGGGCGGSGCGTVFEVTPDGKRKVLYTFTGGKDGGLPVSDPRLTWDPTGDLYGTTSAGGSYGYGVVFAIGPTHIRGQWGETAVYSFKGGSDGANPWAAPIFDAKGNLYGTTTAGGANNDGTVYKIGPHGEEVLHSFGAGTDGQFPANGLIAYKGNFYGTTQLGGTNGQGTIFEVTSRGTESVLYSFTGGSDGGQPDGALLADNAGNFYGTTSTGGGNCGFRCFTSGTVFELSQSGGTLTTLYAFSGDAPRSTLIANGKGNLYGTTRFGGDYGAGTVFKLAPDGTEKVLHSFNAGHDGSQPFEGVIMNADGYLYGTTVSGGKGGCDQFATGCGVVFRVKE